MMNPNGLSALCSTPHALLRQIRQFARRHGKPLLLIPVAPGLEDSDATREHYYDLIMARLTRTGMDVRSSVIFKRSYAHREFMEDYHAYKECLWTGQYPRSDRTAQTFTEKQEGQKSVLYRSIDHPDLVYLPP